MSWSEAKKINSDLKTPLNEGGVKIVKSIQALSYTITNGGGANLAISPVNQEKSIITFSSLYGQTSDNRYSTAIICSFVSDSEIAVSTYGHNNTWCPINVPVRIQVVEFY